MERFEKCDNKKCKHDKETFHDSGKMAAANDECMARASAGEITSMCDYMKCFKHELHLESKRAKKLMKCYFRACGWCGEDSGESDESDESDESHEEITYLAITSFEGPSCAVSSDEM